MAEVKVSALTALTGANVANGDELYIVDTGSPNVSKKITADELAQMPQLSSRYKPLASDRIFISAGAFVPTNGTSQSYIASSGAQRTGAIMFPDGASIHAAAQFQWPSGWTTATVTLYWSNAGAGAGNVALGVRVLTVADGETFAATGSSPGADAVISAPAQDVLKVSAFTGSPLSCTTGSLARVVVFRFGAEVTDTLANDAALVGVAIVRAS